MKTGPFKMKGKSPMMKALIGKQNNLPEQLKAKILAAPDSPAKMIKKKTEREKLNKLVEKRTKLRDKKVKREDKEKNTRRVDRKLEKNQAKINKNPKAQEDKNKKNNQVGGERMVPKRKSQPVPPKTQKTTPAVETLSESMAKMKKASPAKLDGVKDYIKKVGDTKIKDVGKKAVKAVKKVNKKLYDSTLPGKVGNYIKEKKKGKRGASTAGTSAKTIGGLSKSRKSAGKEAASEAAKSYKKQPGPVVKGLGTGMKRLSPGDLKKLSIGKMKKKK